MCRQRLLAGVVPLLALGLLTDGFDIVAGSALRGAARQAVGTVAVTFSYYGVALPAAALLALKARWGVFGLASGMVLGRCERAFARFSPLLRFVVDVRVKCSEPCVGLLLDFQHCMVRSHCIRCVAAVILAGWLCC